MRDWNARYGDLLMDLTSVDQRCIRRDISMWSRSIAWGDAALSTRAMTVG